MAAPSLDPRKNALLAMLPESDLAAMTPQLHPMALNHGDLLYSNTKPLKLAVFPVTAVLSLQMVSSDGAAKHVAMIGREGMLGASFYLGGLSFVGQATVLHAGVGLAISGTHLMGHFVRHPNVRMALMHYTQSLMTQLGMSSVCAQFHKMEQRLARWVLDSTDRMGQNTLHARHVDVADALSVHRPGLSRAARKLSASGAIEYHWGKITVKDRDKLLASACSCYRIVIDDYARLLPGADVPGRTAPRKGT